MELHKQVPLWGDQSWTLMIPIKISENKSYIFKSNVVLLNQNKYNINLSFFLEQPLHQLAQ
jgi:hypothetical protein